MVSVWIMWTLSVLRKQESEGEEALRLAGRETPQHDRGGLPPDCRVTRATRQCSVLLWRWSQAVQLSFIQAFPVLKVVVQVLHKIREVCKSWREAERHLMSSDFESKHSSYILTMLCIGRDTRKLLI